MIRSLLYPLGLFASLLFGLRFFIQWISSERNKRTVVPRTFWVLTLIANATMIIHSAIQIQYPVCLIQSISAVIAWRNLNLQSERPAKTSVAIALVAGAVGVVTIFFLFQRPFTWMRSPLGAPNLSLFWHLLGLGGLLLFASRFWVQWWQAERQKKSYLSHTFWWLSLTGGFVCLTYFLFLRDPVNILGYSLGLIPYIRNLMLSKSAPHFSDSLYLFAGEPSGDLLGSQLLDELLKKYDKICGVGGPKMRTAGMEITLPMERFQVMGITAVLAALPRLFIDFHRVKRQILRENPRAVILIDYADFNMLLAKKLRRRGYKGKIIHYVCPSVWAWRKKRIQKLANTLDALLCILPFEPDCFKNTSLQASYVGHPLISYLENYTYDTDWKLAANKPVLALFPGSRKQEIAHNLPLQWAAAQEFKETHTLAISVAKPEVEAEIKKHVDSTALLIPHERRYELMRESSLALATSGTVILEMGLHGLPTVVTYKLPILNYLVGRYLFRILMPHYTLVNIISGQDVYPEFIHRSLSPEKIARALRNLEVNAIECRKVCSRLRSVLSAYPASKRAAEVVSELLSSYKQ